MNTHTHPTPSPLRLRQRGSGYAAVFLAALTMLLAGALLPAAGTLHAQQIELSMPDTTGMQGTEILLPVYISNSGVDDDIYSWQMEITYVNSRLRNLGVVTENSLNEGSDHLVWSAPASGRLSVAAASGEPLQDEGVLFYIRFELLSSVWSTSVRFTESETWFNDAGTIPLDLQDGSISIQARPSFNVFPAQTTLFVGDSLDMRTSPVTQGVSWQSEFADVATVDQEGVVRALTYGISEITATDTNDVRNQNQAMVDVRSVRLSTPGTEIFQGNSVVVPVYLENPLSHEIVSAEIDMVLSSTLIADYEIHTDESLLEGRQVTHNRSNNTLSVAFALAEPLQTQPDTLQPLFYLEVHSDRNRTGTTLTLGDIWLNDYMNGLGQSETFRVLSLPNVSVSPRDPVLLAGQSQQFSASNTTGELQWSLSNPEVGTIDQDGLLQTTSGGEVVVHVEDEIGATASTNTFRVYDTTVHTPDTTLYSGDTHLIPVRIESLPGDKSVLAFEFDVQYNSSHITGLEPVSTGSMSQGWALSHNQTASNRVRIAAAGTEPVDQAGTLIYLRIHTQPGVSTTFSSFSMPQIMLNEGDPAALTDTPNLRFTTALGQTTLLAPANDSTGVPLEATLRWNPLSGATSYQVQVSEQSNFSEVYIDKQGVDGLSADIELQEDTWYYWRVRAERDPDDVGSWSATWSFTTEPADDEPEPELADFALTSPADNTALTLEGLPDQELEFTWQASASNIDTLQVRYTWYFMPASADTAQAHRRMASADNAEASSLTLTYEQLDELLASLQVDPGQTEQFTWTVAATDSERVLLADNAFALEITRGTVTDAETSPHVPSVFRLEQNYPNPFNPSTVIAYELPEANEVRIDIYDLTGRHIMRLNQGVQVAGRHEVRFDASALSSGTYLYRLQAGTYVQSRAMMLMK